MQKLRKIMGLSGVMVNSKYVSIGSQLTGVYTLLLRLAQQCPSRGPQRPPDSAAYFSGISGSYRHFQEFVALPNVLFSCLRAESVYFVSNLLGD